MNPPCKGCLRCRIVFGPRPKERPTEWQARRFCSNYCSVRWTIEYRKRHPRRRLRPFCVCALPIRGDEQICRLCQREHLRPTQEYPSRRLVRDLVAPPSHDGYVALLAAVFLDEPIPYGSVMEQARSWLDDLLDEIAPLERGEKGDSSMKTFVSGQEFVRLQEEVRDLRAKLAERDRELEILSEEFALADESGHNPDCVIGGRFGSPLDAPQMADLIRKREAAR